MIWFRQGCTKWEAQVQDDLSLVKRDPTTIANDNAGKVIGFAPPPRVVAQPLAQAA